MIYCTISLYGENANYYSKKSKGSKKQNNKEYMFYLIFGNVNFCMRIIRKKKDFCFISILRQHIFFSSFTFFTLSLF